MPKRIELPAELRARPFAVSSALDTGIGAERLRSSDLLRPFHGVRVDRDSPAWNHESAYAARMPTDHYFSHATAARLWRFPQSGRLSELPLHVTAPAPRRAPRAAGVIGHTAPADRRVVTLADGLRVSCAADTWRALAEVLPLDELVIAADALTRRKGALATRAELEAALSRQAGGRGSRRAAAALALSRPRTDSPQETLLRLLIVRSGLPEPVVNYEILNEYGALVALGDLAYPKFKVLVEYDGGQHRDDEKQFNRDVDRLDDVMELDWRVIRVNKSHIATRSAARIAKIRSALIERGWCPP